MEFLSSVIAGPYQLASNSKDSVFSFVISAKPYPLMQGHGQKNIHSMQPITFYFRVKTRFWDGDPQSDLIKVIDQASFPDTDLMVNGSCFTMLILTPDMIWSYF